MKNMAGWIFDQGPRTIVFLPFSVVCCIKLWKQGQSCVHWDLKSSILSCGQSRLTFSLMSGTEKESFLNYANKKASRLMLLLKGVDDKARTDSKVRKEWKILIHCYQENALNLRGPLHTVRANVWFPVINNFSVAIRK